MESGLRSISLLPIHNARDVHGKVFSLFCKYVPGIERKVWLWEHFIDDARSWMPANGLKDLRSNIPEAQKCFVMFEGDGSELPFWIYGGQTDDVIKLIENMPSIEYYIIDVHYNWMISENHHNVMVRIDRKGI